MLAVCEFRTYFLAPNTYLGCPVYLFPLRSSLLKSLNESFIINHFNVTWRFCVRLHQFYKKKALPLPRKALGRRICHYNIEVKTSQDRQIFIFSFQSFWFIPSHMVPLINQQRSPDENSQAGH